MVETSYGGKVSADSLIGTIMTCAVVILGSIFNSMLIYGVLMSLKFSIL